MTKLFVLMAITVMLLAVGSLALADDNDTTANYINTFPADYDISMLNGILAHDHDIYLPDARRNPLGIGLDLVVYESEGIFEAATIESRYDWQNEETSAFIVGRVNLFKAVTNFIR